MFARTLGIDEGLSSGMTITWLKKSIASNGRGILHSNELGSQHLMAIIQGGCAWWSTFAGRKTDVIDMLIFLIQSQNLVARCGVCGKSFALFPLEQVVNWALSKPGYLLFYFGKKQEFTGITGANTRSDAGDAPNRMEGSRTFFGATSLGAFSHMLGIRCEGRILQMFDADQGLFQYSTVSDFKQHMRSYFSTTPPDPIGMEWDWVIMSVKEDRLSIGARV
ncbi:hypothetical protein [Endozoicomonas euniceicola]|uniref:TLDc domain-containing protein n=1 Tax=Endozoicomonas euniceicola TaxID=1234143 RepID=A0ABY6GWU4_9GAMM|nr:hypothetical protein [Endozoicomonas euniceicola]UYM16531.1 hypothetical protein NX720_00930 [Endozoicomonas euniceicola]